MLKEAIKAPDFKLFDQKNNEVKLSDFKGKRVVLYFYPKDNTQGCTRQAIGYRDLYEEFNNLNTVIIGISKDSIKSHCNFISKYDLPFILLSDTNLDILKLYDVYKEKKMYGKTVMGTVRTTYIIDEEGYIIKAMDKVNALENPKDVLDYIKSL